MTVTLTLKPRTTYRNGNGDRVCIAGPARRDLDGQPCWWSIQGNHYTEEGLFVYGRRKNNDFEAFTVKDSALNIISEDTSPEAQRWWQGVKT